MHPLVDMWEALRDAEYLSFGGCGCKAVTYVGFLRALQEKQRDHTAWHAALKGTCGVSSGCIAALAFLVDVDATTLMERWASLNVTSVISSSCFNINGIVQSYGIDDGHLVKRVISEVLGACGLAQDTTFATLARLTHKDLRVCATNLNRMRVERFSSTRTPDVALADAFYWSMCVPFVFMPERFGDDVMIDGCALNFVPVDEWPLENALVLYVDEGSENERRDIANIRAFSTAVLGCCARSIMKRVEEVRNKHPNRMINISVKDEQFDSFMHVPPEAFARLMAQGYACGIGRLMPDVAKSIGILVGWRISDFTPNVD